MAAFLAWTILTIAGWLPGFLMPPAILPGGDKQLQIAGHEFPPATEIVEIPLATGERLRGVFVPSDPGAPVVLHLLESSGSVTSEWASYGAVLQGLADLGFSSLMVDYRGVGASDGDRSPRHLDEDAWAMWCEALRRTQGDPGLVVVRAISIGSLPAAYLTSRGVRPAAWILFAPVRGETVVRHFAEWQYPGILGRMASSFFRPAGDVDLVACVRRMQPPPLVVSPREDVLLPPEEQRIVRAAVEDAGGRWIPSESSHEFTALGAHGIWSFEEADFLATLIPDWPDRSARSLALLTELPEELGALFPPDSSARHRLGELSSRIGRIEALDVAAAALSIDDPSVAARFLRNDLDRRHPWLRELAFEDLLHLFDLQDPAGRLPAAELDRWIQALKHVRWGGAEVACELEPGPIVGILRSSEAEAARGRNVLHEVVTSKWQSAALYPCCELWRTLLEDHALSRSDARRQGARILLKAAAIPDRVIAQSDGSVRLEIREGSGWIPLALDWPVPDPAREHPGAGAGAPR